MNTKTKAELKSSKRQVATVIDINKCMSCQACVVACKNLWTNREGTEHMRWMSVVTAPGQMYPRDYENKGGGYDADGAARPGALPTLVDSGDNFQFNHEEVLFSGNAQTKKLEPRSAAHGGPPEFGYNWDEDQIKGEWPNSYFFYLPRKCNQCSEPACLDACTRKAIYKNADGVVLINQDLCEGHRHCVEACPYKMTFFNPVTKKSEKCIDCYPRLEDGIPSACNRQCPGRTRAFGYLDDEDSQVHKLVKKHAAALPLHPEYGTEPNVYYIPPISTLAFDDDGELTDERRIPDDVLEHYFGADVHRVLDLLKSEREKRRNGEESELMDLLISRNWKDRFGGFDGEPK